MLQLTGSAALGVGILLGQYGNQDNFFEGETHGSLAAVRSLS